MAIPIARARELMDFMSALPRVHLAILPTPLEELPRLSELLGGPRIFVKRDDLTGLAFGGNKLRHLEYHLGTAFQKGANVLITGSNAQSNHVRQSIAAAIKTGMKAAVVLRGKRPEKLEGNILLYDLMGADYRFYDVADIPALALKMYEVADEYTAKGYRPYVIDTGGGSPTEGCVSYLQCMAEMCFQFDEMGIEPTHMTLASYRGTISGLWNGARFLGVSWKIFGICSEPVPGGLPVARQRAVGRANAVSNMLSLGYTFTESDITVYDQYAGSAYDDIPPETREAIQLAAETEGLMLDPLFTGKAMAGIIGLIRQGVLRKGETLVFIHTGGLPALFAYGDQLLRQ
jgi:1-aminocyclopropane-1-carboxylate deaminase/D-cysteine desulfhydrase-like pyridoxal-dependent ACC family enzyme